MNLETLTRNSHISIQNPKFNVDLSSTRLRTYRVTSLTRICNPRKRIITTSVNPNQEIVKLESSNLNSCTSEEAVTVRDYNESIWAQMVEIVKFSGPAIGLWLCGPLMSLIDTAVIGQGSSIELAALGPGTVFCDNTSYVFMFLSIATSNLVATALAKQAGGDLNFISISMTTMFGLASLLVMLFSSKGFGLAGCWFALVAFQWVKSHDSFPTMFVKYWLMLFSI